MKKLLFLLILLIPFMVFAADDNITIKSVNLVDKSPDASLIEEPTFKGNTVNFDIHFSKVTDYLEYEVVIHNGTNDTYIIEEQSVVDDDKTFKYFTEIVDGKNTVKSGEDVTMVLGIKYDSKIDATKFVDGVFSEKNNASIVLTSAQVNPATKRGTIILTILIIGLLVSFILMVSISNKMKATLVLVLSVVSVPLIASALKSVTINVETKITIKNEEMCKFTTTKGSFSETEDLKEINTIVKNDEYKYHYLKTYTMKDISEKNENPVRDVFFYAPYSREEFNDDSYINIYEDNTKENLLLTIDKEFFGRVGYSIPDNNFTYNNAFAYLGIYNINNIYVEVSDDLEAIDKPGYNYSGTSNSKTYNSPIVYQLKWIDQREELVDKIYYDYTGPWVYDVEAINQIKTLYNYEGSNIDSGEWMIGFHRKNGTRDCIYEAKWEYMEVDE